MERSLDPQPSKAIINPEYARYLALDDASKIVAVQCGKGKCLDQINQLVSEAWVAYCATIKPICTESLDMVENRKTASV
jgi:hypothetical protein